MHEVSEILINDYIDILCIAETKLDESFTSAQFHINEYRIYRKDRNAHGGGLMTYVRSSIPHRLRNDTILDDTGVESQVIELILRGEKVIFVFLYKPPLVSNNNLINMLSTMLDSYLNEVKSVFIIGDINVDMQHMTKPMHDFLQMYDLDNVIDKPTCFKNIENPSLIDVMLTNSPRRLAAHLNVSIGVSDHHNIICAATKIQLDRNNIRHIKYRSMKNFSNENFLLDLSHVPFHVCQTFDEPDDIMWSYNKMLTDVIDSHAPVKQKLLKKPQAPYMNGPLRKAINVKAMLRRKFHKYKNGHAWSLYRTQRNLVTSLKRKSIQEYFNQKCNSTTNSRSFWKTVKPFMSEKCKLNNTISLQENDKLVTNQQDICEIFNDYFINIAGDLAENNNVTSMDCASLVNHYANHSDVIFIKDNRKTNSFSFSQVSVKNTHKKLNDLKSNKSCGYDMIPAKLLKIGANELCYSLTNVINNCINANVFPDDCKHAEVSPIFKKKDLLSKCNYRPVSILNAMSKVFEGIICDQLMQFFHNKLSVMLSAYRSKYSCNNLIIKCIEDWRISLDDNEKVGCVAMDLSRAFDSVPHGLLIAKLHAYGVDLNSCEFVLSYLSDRKQRVKLCQMRSDWSYVKRGIPQGSLMGPVLFNLFTNDLIVKLQGLCSIYNYADDNTLSFSHKDVSAIKTKLEEVCKVAVQWFSRNNLKANPEKFQFMVISRKFEDEPVTLDVGGIVIQATNSMKLLGINIDNRLNFKSHVNNLSKSCGRQINALSRMSHILNTNCKKKILEAFVMANFSYCCVVYHNCGKIDSRILEKMLKRALKFVYLDFDSCYVDLLEKANMPSLYVLRQRQMLINVHKILNGNLPPVPANMYLKSINPYRKRLMLPHFNTVMFGYNALRYQGALLWNKLPCDFKVEDFNAFKHKVNNYDFKCHCGNCFICGLISL